MTVLLAKIARYPKAQYHFESSSKPPHVKWVAETFLMLSLLLCSRILVAPAAEFKA